ncbi:MAG TPA: ferredoxin family protein [Solirubrobacterales bacterium]|nr:ferredoxin family protein [Solirubrobacterales bacterium]
MSEPMHGIFIEVEVAPQYSGDAELARKLDDACPVDIFSASDSGVTVVHENKDECVLCGLCLDASPEGAVTVTKLYDGTTLQR